MKLKKKSVLVVGFARSGLTAANFLLKRGARVTITDLHNKNTLKEHISQLVGPVQLSLGGHRLEDFLNTDLIVLSPGVSLSRPELQAASQHNIAILSEVELAYRFVNGTVIGVTGSNGKTTTTSLIGELLKNSGKQSMVAGNIGFPLIQWAETQYGSGAPPTTVVVELSSFQLETIEKFRCHIAALLNLTPDHQDRYQKFEDYIRAKERIFLNQTSGDHAILNADNPHTLEIAERCKSSVLLFSRKRSLEKGVFVQKGIIRIRSKGKNHDLMPIQNIRLIGNHNLENVLAATAVGLVAGLTPKTMAKTFENFRGVEHRLELIAELNSVSFYNDSKATNIDSASRALQALTVPLVVIMGGLDKGADFGKLRPFMADKVKLLILIGSATNKIHKALSGTVKTIAVSDMIEAVQQAHQATVPGDAVLLSPGCASFDMFKNFEHRGRIFKQAVQALENS